MALDGVERTRVEGLARQPIGGGAVEEVPRQRRDVVDARPQRRQAQRYDVQPVEQVLAKPPGVDQAAQVLVGCGDDADVGTLDPRAADRGEVARLEDAEQPRLRVERHVTDLVEEQRAPLRLLEPPRRARRSSGEGTALVPEQFGLDQLARDRRHVDRNERCPPARPHVVDRARDQFLAGPALAEDHHRQRRRHDTRDRAVDFLHRRRAPDQWHVIARRRRLGVRRGNRRRGERAGDGAGQLVEIERLGQIVERARLGRADRGRQRILRAYNDDLQSRPPRQQAGQTVEAVAVGEHDVADDDITDAFVDQPREAGGGLGSAHGVPGAGQCAADDGADCGVVVGDDDGSRGDGGDRCHRSG